MFININNSFCERYSELASSPAGQNETSGAWAGWGEEQWRNADGENQQEPWSGAVYTHTHTVLFRLIN